MATHLVSTVSRAPAGLERLESRISYDEPEPQVPSSQQHRAPAQPPLGFPTSVEGPMVWSGGDTVSFDSQILELGPTDVIEVEQALKYFLGMQKAQHTFYIT